MPAPCRFCATPLRHVFAELGMTPLANSYLTPEQANGMEPFYPLRAYVCERCRLVQLEQFESPADIFSEYAYFSSYSTTWVEHARRYVDHMTELLGLGSGHLVVEIASNDGYLLQHFQANGVPVLGIEPAANVARDAAARGIATKVAFFGSELASGLRAEFAADLLVVNNVLAHVPDLNDFVAGMKLLLKPGGTITIEVPHLLALIEQREWDTIYHEHFSYFSWLTLREIFAAHALRLFDVELLSTHGGSLRIYGAHEDDPREDTDRARALVERELQAGLGKLATYTGFAGVPAADKLEILAFIVALRRDGSRIAAYGAPAKGNTMLNYCGIGTELIEFTCDLNPDKQGRVLPGTHIPIRPVDALRAERPDIVLILPWNLREEIVSQISFIRDWGGRFAVRVPTLTLLP